MHAASKIQALQIISTTTEQFGERTLLHVTVSNVSDKGVVEYAFVRKDGSMMSTSGATTGWILAPGERDAITVPMSPNEGEVATLFAALFDDGTGEGDPQEVTSMRDYRAGVARQFERATAIIRQKKNVRANAQAVAVLDELDKQLSELPEEPVSEAVSPRMAFGIGDAKQFVLQNKPSRERLKADNSAALQGIQADTDRLLGDMEKALTKIHHQPSDLQHSPM
jgi:hypothetical protein